MKLLKIPSRPDSHFLVLTIYSVCVCCVPGFLKKNNNKKLEEADLPRFTLCSWRTTSQVVASTHIHPAIWPQQ